MTQKKRTEEERLPVVDVGLEALPAVVDDLTSDDAVSLLGMAGEGLGHLVEAVGSSGEAVASVAGVAADVAGAAGEVVGGVLGALGEGLSGL